MAPKRRRSLSKHKDRSLCPQKPGNSTGRHGDTRYPSTYRDGDPQNGWAG